jgi:hypothetical protein
MRATSVLSSIWRAVVDGKIRIKKIRMTKLSDYLVEAQKLCASAEAIQKRLAPMFDVAQRFASEFEAMQKVAQTVASESQKASAAFEAMRDLAREREVLLASLVVPKLPRILNGAVISPRPPQFWTPNIDVEPTRRRTIVRPEVKRQIGF